MRRALVLAGLVALMAVVAERAPAWVHADGDAEPAAGGASNDTVSVRRREREVMVQINCSNHGVQSNVWPWVVRDSAGTAVSWRIIESGNVDSIRIRPASPGAAWVLDVAPPYRAKRGEPARGGTLRASNGVRQSRYAIEFWCRNDGSGDAIHGVIDPDIIVL